MNCQLCGKNPASIHYTELSGEAAVEYHICEACAQAKGFLKSSGGEVKFKIGDFLSGMADSAEPDAERGTGLTCESCGKTYAEFRESGRLGCAECYTAFAALLRPLLRRIHGSTDHVGKRPQTGVGAPRPEVELVRLRDELRRALEREDFERCAEIRDRIRSAEGKAREGAGET